MTNSQQNKAIHAGDNKLNSQQRNGQNDADFARSQSIMKGKKQGTSNGYMAGGATVGSIKKEVAKNFENKVGKLKPAKGAGELKEYLKD